MPNASEKRAARKIPPSLVGFGVTLAVIFLYLAGNPLLDYLELKTYDMRLLALPARAPANEVLIAAIDEKSLAALGRWPWSRRTLARLTERLDRLGARVIVFDVLFAEPENQALLEQIRRLEAEAGYPEAASPYAGLKRALAADAALAESLAATRKAVLSVLFLMSEEDTRHVSAQEAGRAFQSIESHAIGEIRDTGNGRLDFPMPEPRGLLANLPQLQAAARYLGHINGLPDRDGTLRRTPLVLRYQGRFFPAADVQAARAYLGAPRLALHTSAFGIEALAIGERVIATDEAGRALIRYYGPEQTVPTVSVADILRGAVPRATIRDRIVLIGATAKAVGDTRVTPYGPVFPGAEIRATVMLNLLHGDFLHRPDWMGMLDLLVLLALGTALALLLPRLSVRAGAAAVALGFGLYIGLAVYLFRVEQVWLNVVYPSTLLAALFVSSTLVQYFTTEAARRQIKSAFQHYVPVKVVEEIVRDVTKLRLGGEKRELTVLFSDIRGFTSVAETLAPEELVRLLNIYLTQMTAKVFAHDGLLDKYIGDALMAVYGAPIARADHAAAACRTALDMMRALAELREQWRREGRPVLDIGIGINTGPMIVGNMGSEARFDYTVIGDAVNLGSRIEGLNKVYGTHILLSEFTYRQVREVFPNLREVDVAHVRGRGAPVRIYELIPANAYPHLDWLPDYARAYELFRAGRGREARPLFEKLRDALRDPVSRYYAERCEDREKIQEPREK